MMSSSSSWSSCNSKIITQQNQKQTYVYSLLSLLSLYFGIIGSSSAVVLVWYGLWGIMDVYLFPQNDALTAISSIIIAILLTFLSYIICLSSSSPSSSCRRRRTRETTILSYNNNHKHNSGTFSVFMTAIIGVCYWRGVWKCWDVFILNNHPVARCSIAVIVGILILLLSSNWKHDIVGPPLFFPEIIQQQQQQQQEINNNNNSMKSELLEGTVSLEETDDDDDDDEDGTQPMISMTVINSNEK